jgi:hypothetical protein
MVRTTLIIVIIVAVVVVFGLVALISRNRPRPLARHLRSTSFSRRRSEAIKRAAAEDVAAVERDSEYFRRDGPGDDPDEL